MHISEKVTVVMPAFNEQEHIERAIAETLETLELICSVFEIIAVNDHSTDHTADIVSHIATNDARVRLVTNTGASGKGSALQYGVQHVTGDIVVFLDADLDLSPRQLPVFFAAYKESGADGVIGSKLHPDSNIQFPWKRKVMSRGYQLLTRMLFRLPYRDTQTGLKLFSREVIDAVFPHIQAERFAYDLEMLLLMHRAGYKIVEAPVQVTLSRQEGSRIGIKAIVQMLYETCVIWIRHFVTRDS